ncbi:gliding motility lipoprotein GldB [Pontibacter silvestris]|uniref:Gliding motility lipoprotein GldB n=1 Tax=Pontibacter silvestris TaxID=2305183 RepID=A0ABW4WVP8_9BACT|nr:gliding motility lipoprotein GldB [Pontibacter silvestris]MCC9136448.1 gliding motility lipoprotein GldB [Pontibacter silvestris]
MYYRLLILATLLLLIGCQNDNCDLPSEISNVSVDVKIERLEKPFFKADSKEDISHFLNNNPLFADKFLQLAQYPSDTVLVNSLYGLATNNELRNLAGEAEQKFENMDKEEQQLETAFKVVKYHYPDFNVPEVKTFVSGLSQDLLVSDSLWVFGVDFFIGKEASYRPDAYEYILRRYERPNMVPTAMLLLSNRFNKTNFLERSLLAEMVSAGKSYYFAQAVMPCTPDSLIIGYSSKEIEGVYYNEDKIWAHFLEKSLLYEKAPFLLQKYMGERPNTPEIDATAPGRIGVWVGWQIVKAYMNRHPEVTLPQLMAETDFQKIFDQSKYRPQKR